MKNLEDRYICPREKWNPQFLATPKALIHYQAFLDLRISKIEYNSTKETLKTIYLLKEYYMLNKNGDLETSIGFYMSEGLEISVFLPYSEKENPLFILSYKDGYNSKKIKARTDLIPIEVPLNIV